MPPAFANPGGVTTERVRSSVDGSGDRGAGGDASRAIDVGLVAVSDVS